MEFLIRPRPIENIEEAYKSQFGPKLYDMFFKPLHREGVGTRLQRTCRPTGSRSAPRASTSGRRARTRSCKSSKKFESLVDQFVYPRFGYQRISDRMQEDIEACGGEVRLQTRP